MADKEIEIVKGNKTAKIMESSLKVHEKKGWKRKPDKSKSTSPSTGNEAETTTDHESTT